jgi:hypothetical protein
LLSLLLLLRGSLLACIAANDNRRWLAVLCCLISRTALCLRTLSSSSPGCGLLCCLCCCLDPLPLSSFGLSALLRHQCCCNIAALVSSGLSARMPGGLGRHLAGLLLLLQQVVG